MRVPWSPVSWGCLGNSAAKRRKRGASAPLRDAPLRPRVGKPGHENNVAERVTSTAGWCARSERDLGADLLPPGDTPRPPSWLALPPRWCRWRRFLPGVAWGSRRPSRPGLQDCSPGAERRGGVWVGSPEL